MKSHETAARARRLRRLHRGPQAGHPARRLGLRRARQRLRAAGARPVATRRWSSRMLIPRGLVANPNDAAQAPRHVRLLQRRDGAVGRPGRDRRHRRHAGCWPGSTATACARCATSCTARRPADRRLRGRHGAAGRGRRSSRRAGSARARCSPSTWTSRSFYEDGELKDMLAATHAYADVDRAHMVELDALISRTRRTSQRFYERDELRRRQFAAGLSIEDLELILHPMVRGRQGSRRLDGRRHAAGGAVRHAIAACTTSSGRTSARSPTRRSTRLRETRVMRLKTRLGNLGNILDEDRPSRARCCR